ncbi:p26 [Cyclophragma undans nucleopolyhedrovirus]|uniref:P26 n=1 Tax=Cyclophragma undans nucleopolyhedrovirus TaxID=1906244 RepID=A0A288Q7G2_9ABAC|nr:p26 [Cyclophragma undans nucleopolyhedrovirus]AOT85490.1 p26 [Cyclophragma undans nucleopolyhedrovirus]
MAKTSCHGVDYETRHAAQRIEIKRVDGVDVFIRVFNPGQEVFDEALDDYHQFPGVATSIVFKQPSLRSEASVMLNDGTLHSAFINEVCFNFHVCNKRFVFGTVSAMQINRRVRDKLYTGSPIFQDNKLISAVTGFHYINEDHYLMAVTGVRESTLVSGHLTAANGVRVEKRLPNMSIYGARQLPYDRIKAFILETQQKRQQQQQQQQQTTVLSLSTDVCVIFYDDTEVRITYSNNGCETLHLRLPGVLMQSKVFYYNL